MRARDPRRPGRAGHDAGPGPLRIRRGCRVRAAVTLAALSFACAGLAAGCAHVQPHPPPGWIPTYKEAEGHREGRGAWGVFDCSLAGRKTRVEGELLAFGPDSVYILDPDGLRVLPAADVGRAVFALYYWSGGAMETETVSPGRADRMRAFARFPGGIPAGLDPRALKREP